MTPTMSRTTSHGWNTANVVPPAFPVMTAPLPATTTRTGFAVKRDGLPVRASMASTYAPLVAQNLHRADVGDHELVERGHRFAHARVDRQVEHLPDPHLGAIGAHPERVDVQRAQRQRRQRHQRDQRGHRGGERRYASTRASHRANRFRASNGPGDASGWN